MNFTTGNIWYYYDLGHTIVIPTNGTLRNDKACVMGVGLAKEVKDKFPLIPYQLGAMIYFEGNKVFLLSRRFISFPVKNHWKDEASLELIEESCKQLVIKTQLFDQIFLPLVGCGNGNRKRYEVLPILEKYLGDKFTLVEL